jgi:hypothetical protein
MTREAYIHQDGQFLRGKLHGNDIRNLRAWPLAGPKHGPRHGHHHLGTSHKLSVTVAGTVEGKPFHRLVRESVFRKTTCGPLRRRP